MTRDLIVAASKKIRNQFEPFGGLLTSSDQHHFTQGGVFVLDAMEDDALTFAETIFQMIEDGRLIDQHKDATTGKYTFYFDGKWMSVEELYAICKPKM